MSRFSASVPPLEEGALVDHGLELLTEEQCLQLLGTAGVGRIGVSIAALPVILPPGSALLPYRRRNQAARRLRPHRRRIRSGRNRSHRALRLERPRHRPSRAGVGGRAARRFRIPAGDRLGSRTAGPPDQDQHRDDLGTPHPARGHGRLRSSTRSQPVASSGWIDPADPSMQRGAPTPSTAEPGRGHRRRSACRGTRRAVPGCRTARPPGWFWGPR